MCGPANRRRLHWRTLVAMILACPVAMATSYEVDKGKGPESACQVLKLAFLKENQMSFEDCASCFSSLQLPNLPSWSKLIDKVLHQSS